MDAGKTRAEISTAHGVTVGSAGVNLKIERGKIFVIMGLSGSGKTTLLRAVNGLNKIGRGRVLVRHGDEVVDVGRSGAKSLRRLRNEAVSMVFQQFALLPWRTVRKNVELGLELRRMPAAEMRETVDQWLDIVGLRPWAEKHAKELSGGMQQRVGLARALATNADILLMDEPFSALDPLIRARLQDELMWLQRTVSKTILFVTHDLDEALKIGDRIAIMQDGKVVQAGRPEDIVLRPATDYVARFVRHMNPLTALRADSLMQLIGGALPSADRYRIVDHDVYEVTLDAAGHLADLRCGDAPIAWRDAPSGEGRIAGEVSVVAPDCLLRDIVEIRQMTGRPVLVGIKGRIVGVCGTNEILNALTHAGRSAFCRENARQKPSRDKPTIHAGQLHDDVTL